MAIDSVSQPEKIAVLLNANARRVTSAMVESARKWVGPENVYYSRSLREAEVMARRIVSKRYTRVICGGGDGTLVTAVNMINRASRASNARRALRYSAQGRDFAPRKPPAFGLMCLGTGNALRRVVNAKGAMTDLQALTAANETRTVLTIPLIQARSNDGKHHERFLFAGVGHDAMALHDYNRLRASMPPHVLRPMTSNVGGYALAMVGRTIPRWLAHRKGLSARVVTHRDAWYVNPKKKDQLEFRPAGTVLHDGPIAFVGVGTVPFLGYGLRMFPFAQNRGDTMQLRIATMSVFRWGAALLPIWRGTYRNQSHIKDFLVSDVKVTLNKPFRYQHSGEDRGERQELHFQISEPPLLLTLPRTKKNHEHRQHRRTASAPPLLIAAQ